MASDQCALRRLDALKFVLQSEFLPLEAAHLVERQDVDALDVGFQHKAAPGLPKHAPPAAARDSKGAYFFGGKLARICSTVCLKLPVAASALILAVADPCHSGWLVSAVCT